jgi:hypothetical protein
MPTVHAPRTYRLADHVRACQVDGRVILLDLRRNHYIGVGGSQLARLSDAIENWPVPAGHASSPRDAKELDAHIDQFMQQGLLSDTPSSTSALPRLEEPRHSADADDDNFSGFEWRQLLRLWRCSSLASFQLKRHSLEAIVHQVASSRPDLPLDDTTEELMAASATFRRLRPFAFTAHDQCLHDSLTLIRFLGAQHLFPRWVIGVRARPFGAHSWVQSGTVVLNDLHEHVRRYQPILVV